MPRPRALDLGCVFMLVGFASCGVAMQPWLAMPMWVRIALVGVGVPVALVYGGLWPADGRETSDGGSSVEMDDDEDGSSSPES